MDIQTYSKLKLVDLIVHYRNKTLSPVEVARLSLDQHNRVEPQINALYEVDEARVMAEAKAAETRWRSGTPISDFDGIPVTIKDSVHAVGMRWHHGSAAHGAGVVGTKDAPPTKRLKRAGAILLGKAKMPDFGLSGSGVSGSHGIIRNPWGLRWNTGGSSAGAGASIAAGIGMMSVGSDIAGSVRLPAAHCGVAAFKPTQGVIPHTPASHERSAGPLVRSAADLDHWTQLLAGPDEDDRYSMPYQRRTLEGDIKIGVSVNFGFGPDTEKAVNLCVMNAATTLERLGYTIQLVETKANFDAYAAIDDSLKVRGWIEYRNLADCHRNKTPDELVSWFVEAATWTPERVHAAHQGIARGVEYANRLLDGVDFLLTPVMPIVNFPAEARGIDPQMPLRHTTFTALFNQSGQPAVALPGGFDARHLPIGVQLVGRRFDDARLLALATKLEAALGLFEGGGANWPLDPVQDHDPPSEREIES